jgi:predicted DNA-binding protein (MmcQ/YjbR family)
MTLESLRDYCLSKPQTTEDTPFGPDTLVFKVMGKIFALTSLDTDELRINLKCNPELAIQLREEYEAVQPGYHQNKKHWNSVYLAGLKDSLIKQWIDHSYDQVVISLPKKAKEQLA